MPQRLFHLLAATCLLAAPYLFAQEDAEKTADDKKTSPQREIKWNNPDGPKRDGIEHHSFMSPSMEIEIGYNVWLPPGYADSTARYPVMYFLHGAGGNENSDGPGFAGIVGRLMAEKKVPPVICVFPNGGMSGYRNNPMTKVLGETLIVKELVPLIDKDFRTKPTCDARVISGFSMGGGGALRLALKYPELFSAAASWAGAIGNRRGGDATPPAEIQVDNLKALNGKVRLLMIVGDKDQTLAGHKPLVDNLEETKYPHKYHVLEGIGHSLGDYYRLTGEEMVLFLAEGLQSR